MGRNSIHKIKKPPRHSALAAVVYIENEDDLFELIERTENPLLLVLEGVQDPHNLGACLRTASGAGVTAVLAPVKGACGLTPTVRDISCGGADDVPFLKIKNIGMLLRKLHDQGIQIVGTSDRGEGNLYAIDQVDLFRGLVRKVPAHFNSRCMNQKIEPGIKLPNSFTHLVDSRTVCEIALEIRRLGACSAELCQKGVPFGCASED